MKKYFVLAIGIIFAASIALVGCSKQEEQKPAETAAPAAPETAPETAPAAPAEQKPADAKK